MKKLFVALMAWCSCGAGWAGVPQPTDVYIANTNTGLIVKVDLTIPDDGAGSNQTVISQGGFLRQPLGMVTDADGIIWLVERDMPGTGSDQGVIRIDPVTGDQTLISSGGFFVVPADIDLEADGSIVVVDFLAVALIRVNPVTGAQSIISQNGAFHNPIGVAVEAGGTIIVVDGRGRITRVDPVTGVQTVLSERRWLQTSSDAVIGPDGNILVLGRRGLIGVDRVTGAQSLINRVRAGELTVESEDSILVGVSDRLLRVNLESGRVKILASGGFLGFPVGSVVGVTMAFPFGTEVACPWDLNRDGMVNIDDRLLLVDSWGLCVGCTADFNGDDLVGADDLVVLSENRGLCPPAGASRWQP